MGFFTSAHHFSLDGYSQDYSEGKTDPRQVVKRAMEVAKSLQAIDRQTRPALKEFQSTQILQHSRRKKHSRDTHSGYLSKGPVYISPEEKAEIEAQLNQMRMKLEARRNEKVQRAEKVTSINRDPKWVGWRDERDSSESEDHAILTHSQMSPSLGVSPRQRRRRSVPGLQASHRPSSVQSPSCPSAVLPVETTFLESHPSQLLDNQQLTHTSHRDASRNFSDPLPLLSPDRFEQFAEPEPDVRDQDGNCRTGGSMTEVQSSEPAPTSLVHTLAPDTPGTSGASQRNLDNGSVPEVKRRRSSLFSLTRFLPRTPKARARARALRQG